jgi:hypothetical protein
MFLLKGNLNMNEEEKKEKNRIRSRNWYRDNLDRAKEAGRIWRTKNHDKKLARDNAWREKNQEKVREYRRAWKIRHPEKARSWDISHSEKRRGYRRKWELAHPEKSGAWKKSHPKELQIRNKKYYANKPEAIIIRNIVYRMFKRISCKKTSHSYQYVGCTPGFLRNHIESLFKPGMTWENKGEWHIDHIIPLSLFPLKDDLSLMFIASHYTNLQPMWGKENLSKHNSFDGERPYVAPRGRK